MTALRGMCRRKGDRNSSELCGKEVQLAVSLIYLRLVLRSLQRRGDPIEGNVVNAAPVRICQDSALVGIQADDFYRKY